MSCPIGFGWIELHRLLQRICPLLGARLGMEGFVDSGVGATELQQQRVNSLVERGASYLCFINTP